MYTIFIVIFHKFTDITFSNLNCNKVYIVLNIWGHCYSNSIESVLILNLLVIGNHAKTLKYIVSNPTTLLYHTGFWLPQTKGFIIQGFIPQTRGSRPHSTFTMSCDACSVALLCEHGCYLSLRWPDRDINHGHTSWSVKVKQSELNEVLYFDWLRTDG